MLPSRMVRVAADVTKTIGEASKAPESPFADARRAAADPVYVLATRSHRRITFMAMTLAVIGGGIGAVAVYQVFDAPALPNAHAEAKSRVAMLLFPLVMAVTGWILGASIGLTFAPSAYLAGPHTMRWKRLVGTERPIELRIACAMCMILLGAALAGLGFVVFKLAKH